MKTHLHFRLTWALLALLGFSAHNALAQSEVVLGSATTASTSYGPIYRSSATSSFDYFKGSYLFTSADLALIPSGATILGVAWDKATTSTMAATADTTAFFKVYAEQNSLTALTSATAWTSVIASATLVVDTTYDAVNNFSGSGWQDYYFSSPIVYAGNSIQISTDWDASLITGGPTTGSFTWRYSTSSGGNTIYSSSSSAITTLSSATAIRPNIKFYYTLPNVNDVSVLSIIGLESSCFLTANEDISVVIANQGSPSQSNFPVSYSVDGNTAITQTYTGTLAGGATDTLTFSTQANLSSVGAHTITSYTGLVGDANVGNDTSTLSISTIITVSSFPYFQSWETGAADWIVGGTPTTWELGAPNDDVINSASHGTQAWMTNLTGDYLVNEKGYVQSPCFDVSSLNVPEINMDVWWEAENSWDGANLQYSEDGGATWNLLGTQGSGVNWYNDATISGLNGAGASSQIGWTGRTNTSNGSNMWLNAKNEMDTAGLASVLQFRIYFGSDGSGQDDGFAFDAFTLQEKPPFNAGVSNIFGGGNNCSSADTFNIVIENFGTAAMSNFDYYTSLNGATPTMSTYSGTIAPGASDTVSIPVTLTLGYNDFLAYTDLLADFDNSNDTMASSSYYGDSPVLLNVNTSSFGSEVYWILLDGDSNVVASIDAGAYVNSSSYYHPICVASTDTFQFQAWDSYGDGWNGGTYELTICDTNGVLIDNAGAVPDNGTSGSFDLEAFEFFYIPSAIAYSPTVNNALCFGDTGSIVLNASGGIAPYSVLWSSGDTTLSVYGAMAGDYTFVLADSTGCFELDTFSISSPDSLSRTLSYTDVICPEFTDGTATITIDSGGVAPFSYEWSDPTMTMLNMVSNLAVGTYFVTTTDANGCETIDEVQISSINPTPAVSITGPDTICGIGAGSLDAGAGFSAYNWSNGLTTQIITISAGGAYSVTITNANGCSNSDSFTVLELADIALDVSAVDVTCEGGDDGVAAATATGGFGLISFNWNDGTMMSTNFDITEGTYTVTVTDEAGCELIDSVTVGYLYNNPDFQFDPNTIGGEGSVTIGSVFTYESFDWSTGASTQTIEVDESGTYSLTVTDTNGCMTSDEITVTIYPLGVNEIGAGSVHIFPNPSAGLFNLSIGNISSETIEMTVLNINGQTLATKQFNAKNGSLNEVIDLSGFASGVYIMNISSNGKVSSYRLNVL